MLVLVSEACVYLQAQVVMLSSALWELRSCTLTLLQQVEQLTGPVWRHKQCVAYKLVCTPCLTDAPVKSSILQGLCACGNHCLSSVMWSELAAGL